MNLSELFTSLYEAAAYLAVALFILFLGKIFFQLLHRDINVKKELVISDNFAFSLAHLGYLGGLLIVIGACIVGESRGLLYDLLDILSYGLLGIILLNLSIFVNDKVILRKFSTKKEIIEDQNAGTGVIEGAMALASGLLIYGALTGESPSFIEGILSTIAFWAIGQVALILASFFYQLITPYNIHEHIEKDNVAVGVGTAGALIAVSILICHAIAGNPNDWENTLFMTALEFILALLLLPLLRLFTDKILLPGQKLTDEIINQEHPNTGAACIEAFAYIGGALLLTWCL